MKILFLVTAIVVSIFLQGCMGKEPAKNDIVGTWISFEKAELILHKDGILTGNNIPVRFGFIPHDTLKNKRFSGSGKWTMRKGSNYREVLLEFSEVNLNNNGCSFPVFIAGENGLLDNKPPWYLFVWAEEEGEDRYKFIKE